MNCPSCGAPVSLPGRFCPGCGAELPAVSQSSLNVESSPTGIGSTPDSVEPDGRRVWWIALGVALVVSLFVPVAFSVARPATSGTFFSSGSPAVPARTLMFWDLFDKSPKLAAWRIVNAILGLTVFVVTLVVRRGVVRGSVMVGAGFMGVILMLSLATSRDAGAVMYAFGNIAVAAVLGTCMLRREGRLPTFAKVTGAVAGGLTVLFLLTGLIIGLATMGETWTAIVGRIVEALYTLTPIIAGILCLVLLRSLPTAKRLVQSAITLTYVYLSCWLGWAAVNPILVGSAGSGTAAAVAVSTGNSVAVNSCVVAYLLLIGWGTAELARSTSDAVRTAE